ncbi:Oxidoreductase [Propionibacterium freudenreichii subsp. freudenreichii]|uniref:Oxidoreductase n=1 Tax=Propionibacterium freudenreichii subsp. freudenreichii TaxID=66712 RepID=A0A0B7NQG9_PROFF|nr:NAD(P)H-binding protein [Propionibacterium freudenreichii]MCT3001286.1 NAD-dependent epimerase/dehydratase family protein [Propionibacterium freudenreichii]CEP26085.1 Oxidoreductase [Propionibacterium freudenreichii subsp. freudenreichii]
MEKKTTTKNVTVLGAHGQIARIVIERLLAETDDHLTLFLRDAARLGNVDAARETVVEGDATSTDDLAKAVRGADIVYANLAGKIEAEADAVVAAMRAAGVKRLIWISSLGIYDEVPGAFGAWNHKMLDGGYLQTYARAAATIEASGLDYTIIRPAWLQDEPTVDYETTQKGEPFKGTEVSRASVADVVVHLINQPDRDIGHSVGVDKPGTDGDKPSFY